MKLVGAVAPLIFIGVRHLPAWTRSRRTRALGWTAAVGLTVYGGVLRVAGWLIEAGVVGAQRMPTSMLLPGTHTSGIPGSRCGAVHSSSRCGAAVRNRPDKPFRTDPPSLRHPRFNSARGPARNRARSAVEGAVSGEVEVATYIWVRPQGPGRRDWRQTAGGCFAHLAERCQNDGYVCSPAFPAADQRPPSSTGVRSSRGEARLV